MRTAAILLLLCGRADAEPPLDTERTLDASSGVTMSTDRPGIALGVRWFATDHIYMSGSLGAAVAFDDDDPERADLATLLSIGAGAGVYGEAGAWTGYGGARAAWVRSVDWPGPASRDPGWLTSGVGAGPTVALARRIGFAWGHPMALELSASYLFYSLRRPEVDVIQIVRPEEEPPARLDGLELGLYLTGTLFPDRPL